MTPPPTGQDVLQHAGQGVLGPGPAPGDVPPVEVRPDQQQQQTLQLLLRHHLTQPDGGPRGVGDPGQHLQERSTGRREGRGQEDGCAAD